MKIAYIVGSGDFLGGAERSFYELVTRLDASRFEPHVILPFPGELERKLRSKGIKVKVFNFPKWSLENTWPMLNILGINLRNPFWHILNHICYIPMAIKIARYLVKNKVDLVHNNSIHPNVLGAIAAKLSKIPYVAHIREFGSQYGLFGKLHKKQYQIVINGATHSIATSNAIKSFYHNSQKSAKITTIWDPVDLENPRLKNTTSSSIATSNAIKSFYHNSPKSAKITTIWDPVDLENPRLKNTISSEKARKLLNLPLNVPIVALIGRIIPLKGHITLLRAANIVKNSGYPNVKYLIVGDLGVAPNDYLNLINENIKTLHLDNDVIFTGFREDISTIYSAIDILAVPSWSESFGIVVVEGMAMGKCVIATCVGGPSEIITDGVDGFLIPPKNPKILADKILYILESQEEAILMQRNAKKKADKFSPQSHVEAMERLYCSILRNYEKSG